jgi:hypothetical protein
MTDAQKLNFLLKELKLAAQQKTCYDDKSSTGHYHFPADKQEVFEDGEVYGLTSFSRALLESMGESYE